MIIFGKAMSGVVASILLFSDTTRAQQVRVEDSHTLNLTYPGSGIVETLMGWFQKDKMTALEKGEPVLVPSNYVCCDSRACILPKQSSGDKDQEAQTPWAAFVHRGSCTADANALSCNASFTSPQDLSFRKFARNVDVRIKQLESGEMLMQQVVPSVGSDSDIPSFLTFPWAGLYFCALAVAVSIICCFWLLCKSKLTLCSRKDDNEEIRDGEDEEALCPICYDTMMEFETRRLPCGHKIHSFCLTQWQVETLGHVFCPICRSVDIPPVWETTEERDE